MLSDIVGALRVVVHDLGLVDALEPSGAAFMKGILSEPAEVTGVRFELTSGRACHSETHRSQVLLVHLAFSALTSKYVHELGKVPSLGELGACDSSSSIGLAEIIQEELADTVFFHNAAVVRERRRHLLSAIMSHPIQQPRPIQQPPCPITATNSATSNQQPSSDQQPSSNIQQQCRATFQVAPETAQDAWWWWWGGTNAR